MLQSGGDPSIYTLAMAGLPAGLRGGFKFPGSTRYRALWKPPPAP